MKQAVLVAPGRIEFHEVPIPQPERGQLLLQIISLGICGSDIHAFHGEHRHVKFPFIQGHEVSAKVAEIGVGVDGFSLGQKVTIQPQIVCGKCYTCTHGKYHICENLKVMGFQAPGCASEYIVIDAAKVLRLPNEASFDQGAMVEPLAVAAHAASRTDEISGKKILVLGAGPIGNLVAQTSMALGALSVMITDVSNYRLEIARKSGIQYCINPIRQDLDQEILRSFGKNKADAIFECVGLGDTITQAVRSARKGTDIVVVGVFGVEPRVNLGFLQRKELRLIGTHMYQQSDFEQAIKMLESKGINTELLISDSFTFERYLEAYKYIEKKKDQVMKVIVRIGNAV